MVDLHFGFFATALFGLFGVFNITFACYCLYQVISKYYHITYFHSRHALLSVSICIIIGIGPNIGSIFISFNLLFNNSFANSYIDGSYSLWLTIFAISMFFCWILEFSILTLRSYLLYFDIHYTNAVLDSEWLNALDPSFNVSSDNFFVKNKPRLGNDYYILTRFVLPITVFFITIVSISIATGYVLAAYCVTIIPLLTCIIIQCVFFGACGNCSNCSNCSNCKVIRKYTIPKFHDSIFIRDEIKYCIIMHLICGMFLISFSLIRIIDGFDNKKQVLNGVWVLHFSSLIPSFGVTFVSSLFVIGKYKNAEKQRLNAKYSNTNSKSNNTNKNKGTQLQVHWSKSQSQSQSHTQTQTQTPRIHYKSRAASTSTGSTSVAGAHAGSRTISPNYKNSHGDSMANGGNGGGGGGHTFNEIIINDSDTNNDGYKSSGDEKLILKREKAIQLLDEWENAITQTKTQFGFKCLMRFLASEFATENLLFVTEYLKIRKLINIPQNLVCTALLWSVKKKMDSIQKKKQKNERKKYWNVFLCLQYFWYFGLGTKKNSTSNFDVILFDV